MLVKNNEGEGRGGGLKRDGGGVINFLPLKRGLIRDGGRLKRGFTVIGII